ncbi:D-alanyl-D-alanine carboxypeptidase family protein [Lapillicoccus jejuensis]|uniref:D-alanyl-D-alanine carboxypeptidase (Penicillin-binding protein 5/6) n=1 Tax=Lapillicoccus jejuensis TaxID=402171 RepID=A0A542E2A6_9MICO|nr:D-alanyl-D-alanine carboxypeptidase [Lapillicoccus jejuensis]TQJ09409.1 D-alanyl-D-alanine carboxypeptidase (penicillin-binding protein 5/6) [Lapillicoccus jejuensis]
MSPRSTRAAVGALVAALLVVAASALPSVAAGPTCGPGATPTVVTAAPSGGRPQPSVTTLADGRTLTPTCQLVPPTPQRGPRIAPADTVGGPRLAASGLVLDAPRGTPAPPAVTDVSWLVADLDTGQVLAAKSPHALLAPASTIKTLLSLVALPALPPTKVVRASAADVAAEGTRVGLVQGAPYTVDQLFLGLVMVSGNDTAYALADALGGRARTVSLMNAAAGRLGAWDTRVVDPSGLDAAGQRSSAYDLALFGRAVMRQSRFRAYAATTATTFPGGIDPTGKVFAPFAIQNHNTLLANYPGAFGVKNGYTTQARHTFIGAARRGGHTLLVTEMGGVTVPSWKPTAALLDWAFAHRAALRPVGTLVAAGTPRPAELTAATSTPTTGPSVSPGSTPTAAVDAAGAPAGPPPPGGEPNAVAALSSPVTYGALAAVLLAVGAGLAGSRRRTRRPAPTPD